MLDTVKTLCYLNGVSGAENEIRDYILERAMPFADRISTDAMGNVLVYKNGVKSGGRRVMLSAHMDEVGLIITGIDDGGCLYFDFVGGIDRRVAVGKKIYIGHDRIPGVVQAGPLRSASGDERNKAPARDEMYIDIGAANRGRAEELVTVGDSAVFCDSVLEMGDGFLKAKALDDRVGCAVMLKLLEDELPCDAWFAFTVQEEVGTRGAGVAAFSLTPEIALILEGTTSSDLPGVDRSKHICSPGAGPVIPFMDGGSIYDRELFNLITALADENGINWQTKGRIAGGTDASVIQRSASGVRVIAVSAAIRNIHTPSCICKISDIEDMLELSRLFLRKISEDTQ